MIDEDEAVKGLEAEFGSDEHGPHVIEGMRPDERWRDIDRFFAMLITLCLAGIGAAILWGPR